MADLVRDIDTIGVVLMEHRSFDHILGYLDQARLLTPIRCAISESCVPSHRDRRSEYGLNEDDGNRVFVRLLGAVEAGRRIE